MAVTAVGRSHPGRVRANNEDCFRLHVQPGEEVGLFVVADGMGGSNAGEVASELAVESVFGAIEPLLRVSGEGAANPGSGDETAEILAAAVLAANQAVYRAGHEDPRRAGMGTTLTAALLLGSRLNVAHVGDSRALMIRCGRWRQITNDHSVAAELVRRGGLTESQAMVHPQRNVLTRALGTEPEIAVDLWDESLETGDTVVLCTDGVTKYLTNPEIGALAGAFGEDLDGAAEAILELANNRGGADNLTVVVLRFFSP